MPEVSQPRLTTLSASRVAGPLRNARASSALQRFGIEGNGRSVGRDEIDMRPPDDEAGRYTTGSHPARVNVLLGHGLAGVPTTLAGPIYFTRGRYLSFRGGCNRRLVD